MQIPSSRFQDWKVAEAELADIEQAFKALSADLSPTDRERVTQQLAALKAARLRVLLLFEAVKEERASMFDRLDDIDDIDDIDEPQEVRTRDDDPQHRPAAEDW